MVDIVLSQSQAASGNSVNLSNSTLLTDFNITPYYDDYDPNKQFYRILYKPGYAVQARELTQMQSMLQSQISRFGRHVFKEGSIVLPGAFSLRTGAKNTNDQTVANPIDYVKVSAYDFANNLIDIEQYNGKILVGSSSNISAYIVDVLPSDGTSQNTNTIYVNYLGAAQSNSAIRTFQEGETLSYSDGTLVVLTENANTSNIIGKSSWFQIEEGVYYAKEHFIYFPTQSVVLNRYNMYPTCKVGFLVSEEIIDYTQDSSLLDPALESSNYSAPGADRLRLASKLQVLPFDNTAGAPDFVTLFTVKNGIYQTKNEDPNYSELGKVLANQTKEESGDYVVRGLNVQIHEHDQVSLPTQNYGRFANGNNQLLVATVDPGVGYAKGYRVELYDVNDSVILTKPMDYELAAEQLAIATMGSYVRVNEIVGTWELDKGTTVDLYDAVQRRITNNGVTTGQKWSIGAQTGNKIGTAVINSVQYSSGTLGYDAIYNVYLSDIRMLGSNSFSTVRSIYRNNGSVASLGADILGASATSSNTQLQEVSKSTLLYYTGARSTRSVRDATNQAKTDYNFYRTDGVATTVTLGAGGTTAITLSGGSNLEFPYGTVTLEGLSNYNVLQDITVTAQESFNIGPLFSGATMSVTGNTVNGIGTNFTRLNVGDKVEFSGKANTWYITGIESDTRMFLSNTADGITSSTIFKAYKTGDIINMAGKGVTAGVNRTIQATPTTLTIDIKESLGTQKQVTVSYKARTKQSLEATKTLRTDQYVKIRCSDAGTVGPYSLGVADVYRVTKVLKNETNPSTEVGTDVTQYFNLNNGQKDNVYDLASIVKSGALGLSSSDWLLVKFDYFEPSYSGRAGFFSIDSYDVEDNDEIATSSQIRTENLPIFTSPSSGLKYELKNFLDFRPVKTATATNLTVSSATINPANTSSSYIFSGNGMLFPTPSSPIEYDYSYYLGRIDLITVGPDAVVTSRTGVPSRNPITPEPLPNQMILAVVNIPPYPSLSPAYGNALYRRDLACVVKKASNRVYTMRDIGLLDRRISALEYYASLSLLEKDAADLKILDANLLDRFKNGIFVDTFRDSTLSAKGVDPDYRIVTDPNEFSIRPLFATQSLGYEYLSGSGVRKHDDNIVMLNYQQVLHYEQPRVTETRNLERGTFFFQGTVTLFPPQDVWVDTSFAPDEVVNINVQDALIDINVDGPGAQNQVASIAKNYLNTEWEGWKTQVTGYNLYRGQGASRTFVGFFTSEEEAKRQAASFGFSAVSSIETLYKDSRSGTNYFSNSSTDTAVGGAKMVSSEIIPYIRPQRIGVKCQNLKGYSKMNVFFDDVNMTKYCTPVTSAQFNEFIAGRAVPRGTNGSFPVEGSDLIVDDFGFLYFIMRIPADAPKFRTGQRRLIVVDNLNLDAQTLSATQDASTTAIGIFFAQGSSQTLQRTVYSTKGLLVTTEQTSETRNRTDIAVITNPPPPPPPKGHCCFDPDAKVLMANCTWKAIKDVVEGDKVVGDNGTVNTVIKNKTIGVGTRKMLKLKDSNFYTTDDHLFLTKKGWKTWRPDIVINDADTINGTLLIGENREKSIDLDDYLKKLSVTESGFKEEFIPYASVEAESFDFDPNFIVHDLTLDGNMTYVVEGYVVHNCCVAYSLLVNGIPDEEEGIFCTGFNIYVARKSRTKGMWFEIGEVDEAGQITNGRLPGTQVWFNNDQIPISSNGKDNPVQIRFDSPVFLMNKKPYAFIIHSDSPSVFDVDPDTQIWTARMGQPDKLTGQFNSDREGTGQYWQTTNNLNWYEVDDVDLKMEIFRADFTSSSGTFYIGNKPIERTLLSNVSSSLKNQLANHFSTGDTLTLTNISGTISTGTRLRGSVSINSANGTVISIPSVGNYVLSNSGYRIGETITALNPTTLATVGSATVSAIANGTASLTYVYERAANTYAEWSQSSGKFATNNTIRLVGTDANIYSANILSINDFQYSVVSFEPKALDFVKTDITYKMNTYDDGSTTPAGYVGIIPSDTFYFDKNKVLRSRSNEVTAVNGDRSNKVEVVMTSISPYVSPVLDLNTTSTLFIENIINANTSGEDGKKGGQAWNKYISQTVTLADDQDAEDIRVYLTSFRPPGTDVIVYAKLLHAQDGEPLAQKNWIQLEKMDDGDSVFSSVADRDNFREFVYKIPNSYMTGEFGQFQYSVGSIKFTGYKYFAVKIVLTSTNPAVVPRCADLRVIALQI